MDTGHRPKMDLDGASARRIVDSTDDAQLAAEDPTVPVATGVTPPRRRILLADDSADNLLILRSHLKRLDAAIDEAQDGGRALEMFMAERYDLVLMDVHMPVLDGLSAIREMREFEGRRGTKATPIVALTASVFGDDIDKCLEAGADIYVAKPVKRTALLEVVTRLLERG